MKAKYLFYSLALASAFTACSQDELFETPVMKNEVAGRPVAGIVTFVNGDIESRYNSEAAKFENGDQMGLYLMDEFIGGEEDDANETLWNWQSAWWKMYNMVDYINTNYGYVYNAKTGEWINRASQLSEGNYIALFPKNNSATNRRDLWHPINANVELADHSSKARYYVNRENQFFVGYEQIKRDQKAGDETGELRADVSMKPIMTYAKFAFENVAANDFKIKKLVFKANRGLALPNLAYVKPSGIVEDGKIAPSWAYSNTTAMKEEYKDVCGNVLATGKYDRTTFTQEAAREMVKYASTVDGQVPYGMTEEQAAPVYEYVFNFPADAEILYGTASKEAKVAEDRTCQISIALPAFEGWNDMQVVVYGEYYDPKVSAYRPGIIRKIDGNDNATFGLDQLALWEMGMEIPMSTVVVDDDYFYQMEEIRVTNTADLINLLNARLSSPQTANKDGQILFEIYPYGDALEITDDVVKVIKNYEAKNKVDVVLNFKASGSYKTPNIVLKAANCIDEFVYSGVNVIVEAEQTIADVEIAGINELTNHSILTIKKVKKNTALDVNSYLYNEVGATINVTEAILDYTVMHNDATLNVTKSTLNGGTAHNHAVMNVTTSNVYGSLDNDNDCDDVNCQKDIAVLTINGTSTIESLCNADKVVVNGTLNVDFINKYGVIDVNGTINLTDLSANYGTINIAEDGEVNAENATLQNFLNKGKYGVINVEGKLHENIDNQGIIYVKNNGWVVISDGESYGIIDVTEANGTETSNAAYAKSGNENYFRYTLGAKDVKGTALYESLAARISKDNLNKNKIILVWGETSPATFYGAGHDDLNITKVIINNDLTISSNKSVSFSNLENECKAYVYGKKVDADYYDKKAFEINGTLTVANGASLTLNDGVNVWVSGAFKANNNSVVAGECNVYGTKTGEVNAYQSSTFAWTNAGIEANKWTGK